MRIWQCHYCRSSLSLDVRQKNRLCPNCGSDIHACRNCVHFNEALSSKCNEPDSPWISDRTTQNQCSFFEMKPVLTAPPTSTSSTDAHSEAERAKEAFRALFRNL